MAAQDIPVPHIDDQARDVVVQLERAWALSDTIFRCLSESPAGEDALFDRPITLRHPWVFYIGHLPAFSWNQLGGDVLGLGAERSFNTEYDALFERGIDVSPLKDNTGQGIENLNIERSKWPTIPEVEAYRDSVRAFIRGEGMGLLVDRAKDVWARDTAGGMTHGLGTQDARADFVTRNLYGLRLVVEHDQMHNETLMYMMANQSPDRKVPPPGVALGAGDEGRAADRGIANSSVAVDAGNVLIGVDPSHASGCRWDIEYPSMTEHVGAFSIDSLPVTVGEFRKFVEAGGYSDPQYWDEDGVALLKTEQMDMPLGWVSAPASDGTARETLHVRSTFDWVPLDDATDWPVRVSACEAEAYARWLGDGSTLPTEAQIHRAAYGEPGNPDAVREFPWESAPAVGEAREDPVVGAARESRWQPAGDGAKRGVFGFDTAQSWRSNNVGSTPAGVSAFGVHELVGNGWEWTRTPIAGAPGFRKMPTYPVYSSDFFDGKHRVVFGGSWATDKPMLRRSFRNWFYTNYSYVFSKFRLVR